MNSNPTEVHSKNNLALITGASSGIGLATSEVLASQGFDLILLARRYNKLEEIKKDLESKYKINVHIFNVDVSNPIQVDIFFGDFKHLAENVNVLINNAGLALGVDKMQNGHRNDWDAMIDTNIKGLLYMTRGLLPYLIKNKNSQIINIGSVAGRWVYPGGGVYCATKFAVRALTEGLRMDLLGTSVKVTNIEPGMVETEFSKVRLGSQEESMKVYQGMTPLSAKDIAETISWCLSRPSHVNIQELVIFPSDQAAVGQVFRR